MTARATDEVGAANLALGHLKQNPIAQLTDNNDRARAVNAAFGAARDATLRQKDWNFATGWMTLSRAAGAVYPGPLKNVFALPADCLRVRHVKDAGDDSWEVVSFATDPNNAAAETAVLVTNLTVVLVCYTRCITLVRLWDADFLPAFAFRLAQFAGAPFVSATRIEALGAQADKWRDEAATTDAQEGAPRTLSRSTSWTQARRTGGSRSGWR